MKLYMTCILTHFCLLHWHSKASHRSIITHTSTMLLLLILWYIYFICRIHVIFGQVLQGQEIVSEIEIQRVDDKSRPLVDVKIINCGELIPKAKAKGTGYVSIDQIYVQNCALAAVLPADPWHHTLALG